MNTQSPTPKLEIDASRQLTAWMSEQNCSLAFTTYQAGKLFLLGLKPDNSLSVFERTFERCMGLTAQQNSLYMTSLYQLWRFENVLTAGEHYQGYDKLFVPKTSHVTGDLDIHDINLNKDGKVVFVNTLFSCIASVSETHSFEALWKPKFISKLAAEDRCHLNGLAMEMGEMKYATAISQSDITDGWRDHRGNGGCVIDIQSNEIVIGDLSMPHSPRLYQGRLWLHNSGTGEFGYIDIQQGKFIPIAFCPGYLRGLSFIGDFAIVGLSKPRHNKTFSGLQLDQKLEDQKISARCGLHIIDLKTGDSVHWLKIEGIVEELYDVVALPGIRSPSALGFKTDEIRRVITIKENEQLLEAEEPQINEPSNPNPILV